MARFSTPKHFFQHVEQVAVQAGDVVLYVHNEAVGPLFQQWGLGSDGDSGEVLRFLVQRDVEVLSVVLRKGDAAHFLIQEAEHVHFEVILPIGDVLQRELARRIGGFGLCHGAIGLFVQGNGGVENAVALVVGDGAGDLVLGNAALRSKLKRHCHAGSQQ